MNRVVCLFTHDTIQLFILLTMFGLIKISIYCPMSEGQKRMSLEDREIVCLFCYSLNKSFEVIIFAPFFFKNTQSFFSNYSLKINLPKHSKFRNNIFEERRIFWVYLLRGFCYSKCIVC